MKTRIAKVKTNRVLEKYNEYAKKHFVYARGNNIPQARLYQDRMKTMRMVLSLLEVHVEGVNKGGRMN